MEHFKNPCKNADCHDSSTKRTIQFKLQDSMFWYVQATAIKCTISNAYKYILMQPRKKKIINYFNIILDFEISRKPGLFRNSPYIGVLMVFSYLSFSLCCSTLGIIYSCSDIPFSFKQVPNLPKFNMHQALAHKDYFSDTNLKLSYVINIMPYHVYAKE